MRKLPAAVLALMLALALMLSCAAAEAENPFADWNPEAPALKALTEYVAAVTDENSPDYIPPADRIAAFDMDGTLVTELAPTYLEYYALAWRILKDTSWTPDAETLAFGRLVRDHALDRSFPEDIGLVDDNFIAKAFAGMTLTQYADFINGCLVREADGFEGMTYANAFFTPMTEVVEYLQENGFKVYVVSGSDRFFCRTLIEGVLDIPYEQIIGKDVALEASNQGGTDAMEYVYTAEDTLVRTDRLLNKTVKMNKVQQIARQIGRQPVLAFGNSTVDVSMLNYTIFGNKYRSAAFMLIADNDELDYGSAEKVQPLKEMWEASGYHVISMKDDFRTVFGDEVKKTGTFRWAEDLAENRTAAEEAAPAGETEGGAAETEESTDIQYVLYLGTNDKDTNAPVFTQAEALEQLKAILLRYFGGYTIQEASGGWVDNGIEYQEYTLVIYLSDTTIEKIHAAADEMVETFRQSSVLIQQNPTKTEFYSPAQ